MLKASNLYQSIDLFFSFQKSIQSENIY